MSLRFPLDGAARTVGYDLVCFSDVRWDRVFHRTKHFMTRFAARARVFFVEEAVSDDRFNHLAIKGHEGVIVVTPHVHPSADPRRAHDVVRRLIQSLFTAERIRQYVLWYCTPRCFRAHLHLTPVASVYDCAEEPSTPCGPHDVCTDVASAPSPAEPIFQRAASPTVESTGARRILNRWDLSRLSAAHDGARGNEPGSRLPPAPKLGFFGVLDARLNRALIAAIARLSPEWQIVFVGLMDKLDPASPPGAPSIQYLGAHLAESLPEFRAGWDVALVPLSGEHAPGEGAASVRQRLADGRPTVIGAIPEVARLFGARGLVEVADDLVDFTAAVDTCFARPDTPRRAAANQPLYGSSWDHSRDEIVELIDATVLANPQRYLSRYAPDL